MDSHKNILNFTQQKNKFHNCNHANEHTLLPIIFFLYFQVVSIQISTRNGLIRIQIKGPSLQRRESMYRIFTVAVTFVTSLVIFNFHPLDNSLISHGFRIEPELISTKDFHLSSEVDKRIFMKLTRFLAQSYLDTKNLQMHFATGQRLEA